MRQSPLGAIERAHRRVELRRKVMEVMPVDEPVCVRVEAWRFRSGNETVEFSVWSSHKHFIANTPDGLLAKVIDEQLTGDVAEIGELPVSPLPVEVL